MISVVIAYHSGYGHTRRVAEAVRDGAASVSVVDARTIEVDSIDDAGWRALESANAIVFGAPTYMGGASGEFKIFADASSKVWLGQGWKDKVAGGFTCSQNMCGDKYSTLMYFVTLAMQHSMVWVGTATMPSPTPGHPDQANRLGSSLGVMAQADNVAPELSPPGGDLETARAYGRRIAEKARALARAQP